MKEWKFKINKFKFGFVTGLILPVMGFFIGFLAKGGDLSFSTFWQLFIQNHDLIHLNDIKLIYQDTRQSTVMFTARPITTAINPKQRVSAESTG